MRSLKLLFLLLPPALLPAAQIVAGSVTLTTFLGQNFLNRGTTNIQTADTSVTGILAVNLNSPYINSPYFPDFNGSIVVDPSGSICGGGISFSGRSFTADCSSSNQATIFGNFAVGTFLYSGGPVTAHLPFTLNLDITSYIIGPGPHDFPFSGSGTADLIGHSVPSPNGNHSNSSFIVDSLALNFVNVPEPTSAALVFLSLAAVAVAAARRRFLFTE